MTKQITEQMIREAAYFLWEKAGCPDGTGEEFWLQAHVQFFGEPETTKKTAGKKGVVKKASCKTAKKKTSSEK